MQLLYFLYKVYVFDQQINITFRTHSLYLNDTKHGVYKISSNLVPGRKSLWLTFGRHPTTISSAPPNTPTDVLRAFLQPILANGQKIPRLRQYFLWKLIIHMLWMLQPDWDAKIATKQTRKATSLLLLVHCKGSRRSLSAVQKNFIRIRYYRNEIPKLKAQHPFCRLSLVNPVMPTALR